MKLLGASNAIVEQQKLVHYLLNAAHPDNGGKSAFFTRLGFTADKWIVFAQALRDLAVAYDYVSEVSSPFGGKYVIDGILRGPLGITGRVRTVWITEPTAPVPRLVTAYPVDRMES